MATTDELLESAEEESEVLTIDWDTREIDIPSTVTILGVESDDDTTRLYFQCPAEYGEFDISTFGIRINYVNYNSSGVAQAKDIYYVEDAESDGDTISFSWLVGRNAYLSKGTTKFIICCKLLDSDGEVTNELNTTLASLPVLEGLETTEAVTSEYADIIDQLWQKVNGYTDGDEVSY